MNSPPEPPGPRIAREQETIAAMLRIYCRDRHGGTEALCPVCATLLAYARRRLESCPFGEDKPACNHCTVHCYSRSRRHQIREVMRQAGPRMLLRHPLLSLYHLLDTRRKAPILKRRRDPG